MVQKVKTISSNDRYDNRNDEARVYDIEANVSSSEGKAGGMDAGSVYSSGVQVAQFNLWGENHMNFTYQGIGVEEMNAVNLAVDAFIAEVKESVSYNA